MNPVIAATRGNRCKSNGEPIQVQEIGKKEVNKQAFSDWTKMEMHFQLGCWLGDDYLNFFKLTPVHSRGSRGGCIWEDKKLLSCVLLSFSL